MTDESTPEPQKPKEQDVELNEAFERYEKKVDASESTPVTPKSRRPDAQTVSASGGVSIVGVLALVIAFLALGVGSYAAYTSWSLQQLAQTDEVSSQLVTLRNEVASVRALQDSNVARSEALKSEILALNEAQSANTQELEAKIATGMAELRSALGTSSEDWLLAEAEYLLRLASQRVVMEDDIAGAIALFEAADKIVKEAQGVVAFALREAIAQDIAALKAVSSADIDGIFVQLGAVAEQIPNLPQKDLRFNARPIPDSPATGEELSFVQQLGSIATRAGARIANLVDYRAKGEVITPILPPKEEYYLRQNLRLKIQMSQLGLLKRNQSIFEQSIGEARAWVEQYFDVEDSATVSVLETLANLQGEQIERDLPDVSSSLREIRKLLVVFHQASERSES